MYRVSRRMTIITYLHKCADLFLSKVRASRQAMHQSTSSVEKPIMRSVASRQDVISRKIGDNMTIFLRVSGRAPGDLEP